MILPLGERIGELNYGQVRSEILWVRGNNATLEVLRLGNDIYLVRGAKQYYIADISEPEQFHSKLQEIGVFSDYLKESVPSFSLSLFYVNSLTGGMIGLDSSSLREQIGELKRAIMHKEARLGAVREEQEMFKLPIGREGISLEAEIKEKREKMRKLEDEIERSEQFKREYSQKGHGASVVIKSQTALMPCRSDELEKTAKLILNDLEDFDNVIKNRAKQGFHLVVKELPNPALGYSTESLGLLEPNTLEDLVSRFPELESLKDQINSIFVHRWAKDARIGERTFEKSSAIAQGIATLLRRAAGKAEAEPRVEEPRWDKLPFFDPKKPQGYLGFVCDGYLERTKFPFLINYDDQIQNPHIAIIGASGFGKTVTAYDIAEGAVLQGIPVLVLDPTGQWTGFLEKCDDGKLLDKYRKFGMEEPVAFRGKIYTPSSDIGASLTTNLLARPNTDKESELQAYAIELSMIIQDFCRLSDNETVELRNAVFSSWKNGTDLDHVSLMNLIGKEMTKMKLNNLVAVSFLFEGKGFADISQLWKEGEISIVTLTEVRVETVKMFVAYYLIRELINYFDSQPDSDKLRLLLVVEEAHRFKEIAVHTILDRAAKMLRKKGVAIVFITQILVDLEEIRANVATRIYMRTTYERDIYRANIDMGSKFGALLPSLKVGEGIVSNPMFQVPAVVHFRPCFHRNIGLASEQIKEKMVMWREQSVSSLLEEESKSESMELTNEEMFYNEILAYHDKLGKWPRYTDIMGRLGWKSDKIGTQVKKSLIDQGKIKEEPDPEDKRAKRLIAESVASS